MYNQNWLASGKHSLIISISRVHLSMQFQQRTEKYGMNTVNQSILFRKMSSYGFRKFNELTSSYLGYLPNSQQHNCFRGITQLTINKKLKNLLICQT